MSNDISSGGMVYFCCEPRRRNEIARLIEDGATNLNGIDFLEVLDAPTQAPADRQRTLFVHFIQDPSGLGIVRESLRLQGGERIRDVRVATAEVRVEPLAGTAVPVLVVVVDTAGDFSTYTLRLVPTSASPLPGLDPMLRAVDFSFKVNCETKFDPLHQRGPGGGACPPGQRNEPSLDYLARDFNSLRQLMLDRMSVRLPDWTPPGGQRNPADLGVVLVELLAYVGDQLSYRQDAVATEAYLGTCRLRTSARRHARLVDYFMHDGCNARAWVQVRLEDGTPPFELREATFYSAVPGLPRRIIPDSRDHAAAANGAAAAFQLLEPALLAPEHNEMAFYTWGARECCLPKGAVRATLRGDLPNLHRGMVLAFQEVRSPRTGDPDDADLSRRHALRLVDVSAGSDPLGGRFNDPPTNGPVPVTEIRWADEDALPFPICISAETAKEFGARFVDGVSVALGNIVLADHGAEVKEDLGAVPQSSIQQLDVTGTAGSASMQAACREDRVVVAPVRFRPSLKRGPVTQAVPYDAQNKTPSAAAVMRFQPRDALPAIKLEDQTTEPWAPRLDLLSSGVKKHFVVEVDAEGADFGGGRLRFGDGKHGEAPRAGKFTATYRVGNGRAGNVGAQTLVHIVTRKNGVLDTSNPLPATGGVDMETIQEVRQYAPFAFKPQTVPGQVGRPLGATLRRAVTPADYAAVAEAASVLETSDVQRAAATFRWTGSWRTTSVTVDRRGGGPMSAEFEDALRVYMEPYRMAGHDVEIEPPKSVAMEIAMRVRVKPGYFTSQVRRALLDVFSNRLLPDGRRGVFHPDNLTFGQTIYLSPLYAAAQEVDGVASVDITKFQRADWPGDEARDAGRLPLGRLEIARLDNDPNFPERGVFELSLEGAR